MSDREKPDSRKSAEYVLGAEPVERARLEHQHQVWAGSARSAFARADVAPGWRVLDAGCGPGLVLAELRELVGEEGEVWGVDLVPEMVAEARELAAVRGWQNVRLLEGDLNEAELPPAAFDLVWLRWMLSFPADPGAIVTRLAACLRPGGRMVVQDYDHDGVGLFPRSGGFDAAVRATRAMYQRRGGDPWVGARLPALARAAGLELEDFRAEVGTGGPGEPVYEWADRFFPRYVDKYLAEGLMSVAEAEAFHSEWQERRADPDTRFFSPIVVTAIARRPLCSR
ncbi:MAG TPA: methyltransferase domain-containing protein [Planctomycetota bacterium]